MIKLGLYVIIDPYNLGNNDFNEICKKITESNVDTIQLRNKFGNKVEIEAQNRDLLVVDATCPLVKKVHIEASKYASKNYKVLLVGHKGHPEVEGTSGRVEQGIILIENVEQ